MTTKLKPTCDTDPVGAADQIENTVTLATVAFDHPDLSDDELDAACEDALSDCFDQVKVVRGSPKRKSVAGDA